MNKEIMNQLKENFPILKTLEDDITIELDYKNELGLNTENTYYTLSQQDCLELSQLFALLATGFEEVAE